MKPGIVALALVLGAGISPAFAAKIKATSNIDSVTVFPRGAEVTRLANIKLVTGEHTIIINDLPVPVTPNSIRVEGEASGGLEIGSVDNRTVFVDVGGNSPALDKTERKRLEEEIEKLGDDRSGLDNRIKTAQTQQALLQRLTELPARPVPAGGTSSQTDWVQILDLIGSRLSKIHDSILKTRIERRVLDRQIEKLRKRLVAQPASVKQRTQVQIHVSASEALTGTIKIRYQVPNAGWTPFYDARLSTGDKQTRPVLQMIRRASITQRTGEPWNDAALKLSTTRPRQGASAPKLHPLKVDIYRPRPVPVARKRKRVGTSFDMAEQSRPQAAPMGRAAGLANKIRRISVKKTPGGCKALRVSGGV